MVRDVHLDLRAIDTMHQQTLFRVVIEVHAKDRPQTHFEDLVFRQDMQTRVRQIEVRHVGNPLRYMHVTVTLING